MNKKTQGILMISFTVTVAVTVAVLYTRLPAMIPMQWGFTGKVNYSWPKLPVVIGMIAVNAIYNTYSWIVHKNDATISNKDFLSSVVFAVICIVVLGIAVAI